MSDIRIRDIGEVGNYYGRIAIKNEDGSLYWSIENWDGHHWEPCPDYLFEALSRHQDELEAADQARGTA
ncbi:hypothetical protein [Stutzerimonas nitrititolerans]|uniref:hypothetical protein n=1 Tax=Stutzerimonas nitrititolerans TaxID=2482751 RepID=UPI00289877C1|nr:hypothetical protein [Stutzerimonas nitrititolerans]